MVARETLQSKTETYLSVLQKNNYVTDGVCLHPLQLKSIKSLRTITEDEKHLVHKTYNSCVSYFVCNDSYL